MLDLELLKVIFSGLTFISIFIAYLSYRNNVKRQEKEELIKNDKDILSQAIRSLEWAYSALTRGINEDSSLPIADRLNWLTCARHIARYKSLKKMIVTDTYRLICDENEEYWRHRFYLTLDQEALRNRSYYTDKEDKSWPENIELKSAMIISDFSNWQESIEDPLDGIDEESLMKGKAFSGLHGRGIESYYCLFEEIKVQAEKEHNNDN